MGDKKAYSSVYLQVCPMPKSLFQRENLLSGFQWFFFIFCNTVVVPPTLVSAFHLPDSSLLMLTQYAFLSTAVYCRSFLATAAPLWKGQPAYGGVPF